MSVEDSLHAIGRDPAARARIVAALIEYERLPENRFTTVRDEVTGPIVDALHFSIDTVRKELSSGLVFEFPYRSKIARDFIMSVPEKPSHVWEPQTTKLLLRLAETAADVVVGGAYFGDQAILIADALRGRGKCHAFEPDEVQARMLRRNAELNGLDNVRVNAVGLWSDAVSRLSFVGHDALAGTVASAEGIPATTIDAYAEEAGIESVGLIMLDLEGAELAVLRGAARVLRYHAPHVVFEIHGSYVDWSNGLEDTEVVRYLRSFGYSLFAVRDFQSNVDLGDRPVELVPLDGAWLEGPPHGFNLVAVRDRALLDGDFYRVTPNVSPKLLLHRDPRLHHPTGGL
jgi:FkbM family methyltransferase